MSEIPTRWAVVEFGWGEGHNHIFSKFNSSICYYQTEPDARSAARMMIRDDNAKGVAILEVKALIEPKPIEFWETV